MRRWFWLAVALSVIVQDIAFPRGSEWFHFDLSWQRWAIAFASWGMFVCGSAYERRGK